MITTKNAVTRSISLMLTLFLVVSTIFPSTAQALSFEPDFDLNAEGVYMINLDANQVVFEKNQNQKIYPASLTKIMTAIVALENIDDLQVEITYKNSIQDQMNLLNREYGGISLGGLIAGEVLTAEKLLYATMLPSANEAATILADYVGGDSVPTFIEMMNAKAKEIGANDTNFENPHGLHHPDQITTPYDMALITQYALENDMFRTIIETNFYDGSPTNIHPTDLFWNTTSKLAVPSSEYYVKGSTGIKTGTLAESGRHAISLAKRGGYEYLLVVMGAPFYDETGQPHVKNNAFVDSKKLYEWAFSTFTNKTILTKGEVYNEIAVDMADDRENPYLKVRASEDFIALLPSDIPVSSIQLKYNLAESIDAPIESGDVVGTVDLILTDEVIGTVNLEASRSMQRSTFLYILNLFGLMFDSFLFKFILTLIVLLFVGYIFWTFTRYRNHKRHRTIRRHRRF